MFLTCLASLALGLQTPVTQPQTPAPAPAPKQAVAVELPVVLPAPSGDTVVGLANGKPLTASELAPYLWDWRAAEVAQELLSLSAVRQAGAAANVKVTPEEIQARLLEWPEQVKAQLQPGQTVQTFMMSKGITQTRLATSIERRLILEKLAGSQFDPTAFVHAQGLFIEPKSQAAADVQSALTRAQAAYASLKKGTAWEKVLAAYNTNQQMLPTKGDLRWLPNSGLPAEVQSQLKTVPDGGVTSPVQLNNNWVILRVLKRGNAATREEREEIRTRFFENLVRQKYDEILKNAKIENKLMPKA